MTIIGVPQGEIHDELIGFLFDEAAWRYPEAIALRCGDHSLRYGDLADQANRLARWLAGQGVGRGDRVALLAGRSIETILAILGIVKAGAAYLPLDPQDPPARRDGILAESAPALVLVGAEIEMAGDLAGAVSLPGAIAEAAREPDTALPYRNDPADVACVMYTSGSTGRPKGVEVPHRAVVRLVRNQDYAPFGPSETLLHLAPLAFDASTFEIWGALLHGGQLAIVPDAQPSLDRIAEVIARDKVTMAWFTAGLFSLLVDHRLEALRPLRCILAGGDVLSPAHVRRAYDGLPATRIVNGYGPTENTTFTCCYPVPRDHDGGALPIGTPIRGTRVHLLDAALKPVGPGEIGQICCAGLGLANGYLAQPARTAEAFVTVAWDDGRRERLYLTGDLGRWRDDGALEFCGRTDFQVKISGKRIELGEIENALRADPEIADAVVVARLHPSGVKQLIGYVKPWRAWPAAQRNALSEATVARLRERLPVVMIPALLIELDDFPLLPSGKVDRNALPPPEAAGRASMVPNSASAIEQQIAAIWKRCLGRTDIDHGANFFDLGGSSLLLMAVHAELQAKVSPRLSLVALLEHTSVRALSAFLAKADHQPRPSTKRPMPARAPRSTAPWEHAR